MPDEEYDYLAPANAAARGVPAPSSERPERFDCPNCGETRMADEAGTQKCEECGAVIVTDRPDIDRLADTLRKKALYRSFKAKDEFDVALDELVAHARTTMDCLVGSQTALAAEHRRAEAAERAKSHLGERVTVLGDSLRIARERAEAAKARVAELEAALREAEAVLVEIASKPYRAEEATAHYFERRRLAALSGAGGSGC